MNVKWIPAVFLCFMFENSFSGNTSTHCMGNGAYCVYAQGMDIDQVFGPPYSSPTYMQLKITGTTGIQISTQRIRGTAIWQHQLSKNNEVFATVTDFVDAGHPVFCRKIESTRRFELSLKVSNQTEVNVCLNTEAFRKDVSGALLLHKNPGLHIMQHYLHPHEQFHQLLVSGAVTIYPTSDDTYSLIIDPGESEIYIAGGPDYEACYRNSMVALNAGYEALFDATRISWMDYTGRRKDFSKLLKEGTKKQDMLDQIDNVAVLLKSQQSLEGGVIAGSAYHLAYVRDQYGVARGFLSLGYYEEARKILEYYRKVFQTFGVIHNAQAPGIPGMFHQHENDGVEITGYLIIQAFDYLKATHDTAFIRSVLPMLEWAWRAQVKNLRKNMLPFNGDETYIAGGLVPRTVLNDGSSEATMLFIESGRLLLPFLEEMGYWKPDSIDTHMRYQREVESDYLENFTRNGKIMVNNPQRMTIDEMPMFRNGVCAGLHGVVQTKRDEYGNYFCPLCMSEKKDWGPVNRDIYTLSSIALTPVFIGSGVFPDIIRQNIMTIRDAYQNRGAISSRTGEKKVIGYEYGYLLLALTRYNDPLASTVFDDMMSVTDDSGAWVEYYVNGKPAGCPYRPWESAINIVALIEYGMK